MKIWKPITRYKKFRDEVAYHTDFSLSAGEVLVLFAGQEEVVSQLAGYDVEPVCIHETCPPGVEWKIHLEIAIEPFPVDEGEPD